MRRLAAAPNVAVKLSGFGLGHPGWTVGDTVPLLRRTVDLFGPERTMCGTNLPVDRLFAPPAQTFDAIDATNRGLSHAERRMVLQGTAARIYRLGRHDVLAERLPRSSVSCSFLFAQSGCSILPRNSGAFPRLPRN